MTIVALTETDGECTFRLNVGATKVGEKQNPASTTDYLEEMHTFAGVMIAAGDVISVDANVHSNMKIPEAAVTACGKANANGGRAWARGRWARIVLLPRP